MRGDDERKTLEIYKGATVIAGDSLWIPSRPFIDQLKAAGAITGGSGSVAGVWGTAKEAVGGAVDVAKYTAGFVVGTLEGAYNAIVDLFKGAVDMVEAVFKVVWNLVTGNLGAIKAMLMGWVDKMKLAWEHRGEIAEEFLKKWNAESSWDRGLFQGDVLGWLMMTVLLILVTMGEDAPAALAGIAVRWPQLVKLIKTVDTLGDVTTYLGAAAKAVKLPGKAAAFVAGKMGKAERVAEHVAEDVSKDAGRAGKKAEHAAADATHAGEDEARSITRRRVGGAAGRRGHRLTAVERADNAISPSPSPTKFELRDVAARHPELARLVGTGIVTGSSVAGAERHRTRSSSTAPTTTAAQPG